MRLLSHMASEAPYSWKDCNPAMTYDIHHVTGNADGSILVCHTYYSAKRSTDYARTWSTISPVPGHFESDVDDYIISLRYLNGYFITAGWTGAHFGEPDDHVWIYYSTDGSSGSWTFQQALTGSYGYPYGMCYGGGKYLMALGSVYIAHATTLGGTWTAVNVGFGKYDCAYGNSTYVIVGSTGNIKYSSDCTTWTTASVPSFGTSIIRGVCYGTKFVAVGDSGKIGYSTDGNNWTQASSTGVTSSLYHVRYCSIDGCDWYYAVGASGKIIYSHDADVWTAVVDSGFSSNSVLDVTVHPIIAVASGVGTRLRWAVP